jgi:hypothetical protein
MAGQITFQSFQPLPSGAAYYGNAFQLSFVAYEPRLLSAFLKLTFNFPDEVSCSFAPSAFVLVATGSPFFNGLPL